MQIMCYEQLLKMLFKTKQNQKNNFKYNQHSLNEINIPSEEYRKLQMNPVYDNFRRCIDSDESCSSSNTYAETLDPDSSNVYRCDNCRHIQKSVCNNSLHFTDFRRFRKRYPEYLTPQQISRTTKITLPPHVDRVYHRKIKNEDRFSIFSDRKILVFDQSSRVEKIAEKSAFEKDFSNFSYHVTKTFNAPPPNINPFDLSEAHF